MGNASVAESQISDLTVIGLHQDRQRMHSRSLVGVNKPINKVGDGEEAQVKSTEKHQISLHRCGSYIVVNVGRYVY